MELQESISRSKLFLKLVTNVGKRESLIKTAADRPATETEYRHRIREHLGYRPFDEAARHKLSVWLNEQGGSQGPAVTPLVELARAALRRWKVELPAMSTLHRMAGTTSAATERSTWQAVVDHLTVEQKAKIDELLQVRDGDRRSLLFELKQYPPAPTPATINDYLERYQVLSSFGCGRLNFSDLSADNAAHLAALVRRYNVWDLSRLSPNKRYALVACFLAEAHKTMLDHLVEMNGVFLTGMNRRARRALDERHKEVREHGKKGMDVILAAMDHLLDPKLARDKSLSYLYEQLNEAELREAVLNCRDLQKLHEHGLADALRARHSHLKRYLPAFLKLPFQAETGSAALLESIAIARRMHAGELTCLPKDAPTGFVPAAWRRSLTDSDGLVDNRLWETALAFAVRKALRSGDLYLPDSRHHVSFWNLVHNSNRWEAQRQQAYKKLGIPQAPVAALDSLEKQLNEATDAFGKGLSSNSFATVDNGALSLTCRDALEIPQEVTALRHAIEAHLPRVRIEDLVADVDGWCHFSKHLRPTDGYQPRGASMPGLISAALVAHGTNLGIATMAQSAEGMSIDELRHVSHWCLRKETLKAANRTLIDHHHGLSLSAVWGQGNASSSDGQRFAVQQDSLLSTFCPRYFGYYQRAISIYTHVSDQYSVFSSQAISCSVREAVHVLDGLLENDTILRPREHYTDTHGFTEQLFGLCYLLGYSFMPRLKDLKDQRLYKMARAQEYDGLDSLFCGTADVALVKEQWDQLVRVAASLRDRTAPAHKVLERLAARCHSDRLAKALNALGRIVKTVYILRYLHDPAIRDRVQLQLNRGESRHELARWLFFANQGVFRSGDYEEIMNKVSALAVLSNAALVWNTVAIGKIVNRMRASGTPVLDHHLARVSPLLHAHIIPSGTYHFERLKQLSQP